MSEAYSRIYHRFAREFDAIYADDRALAAWLRLLLQADASWPLRPPLPRSVRPKTLDTLVTAGLVELCGDNYTILGLDAERTRRRDAARTGAAKRWQSDGNANADAIAMPRRDETSKRLDERDSPPPPTSGGRRKTKTNPRVNGEAPRQKAANPRSKGTSVRQVRANQKRGSTKLGEVLRDPRVGLTEAEAEPSEGPSWMQAKP